MSASDTYRAKLVEQEIKKKENSIYTRFITSMGVIILIAVTLLTLLHDLEMTRELLAFFAMGAVFVTGGLLWSVIDNKAREKAMEDFMDFANDEEEAQRLYPKN